MQVHDWVIVGGGLHGVCAARGLVAQGASVRIVDPSGRLLERWCARGENVAMVWMRSPLGHHLDAPPAAMHHFLHEPENADVAQLAGTFRRPAFAAFNRHTRSLIERHGLDALVVGGRAEAIEVERGQLIVTGENCSLRARRVLLATGSNQPRLPDWARALLRDGAPVRHVFSPDVGLDHDIVGGGISAVQRAVMVHRRTQRTVRLWMRRPIRVEEFDFDRDWAKHRFMRDWSALDDAKRLDFLERHPPQGTVPPKLASRFEQAVRSGRIEVEYGEPVVERSPDDGGLLLRSDGRTVEAEGLTLATGYLPETLPDWLRATAERLDLPTFGGLPRLAQDMHWGHGLHVSGPLARLRLGPMASNIVGARWASSLLPGVRMQPV